MRSTRLCLFVLMAGLFLQARESENRTLVFQFEHRFERTHSRDYMQIRIALPVTEPGRQTIHAIRFDPAPDRQKDEEGKRIAEWKWKDFARRKTIQVHVAAELIPPTGEADRSPGLLPDQMAHLLKPEPFIESDAEEIREMAEAIPDQDDLEAMVQAIVDQVVAHLSYDGFNPEDLGALAAAKGRKGDCTEYADLFTALCRAKGIPARSRLCLLTRTVDTPLHSVSEVYLPGKGWKVVDPLWGELTGRPQSELPNRYLFLSTTRNDKDMFGKFSDRVFQKFGKQVSESAETSLRILEKTPDGGVKKVESTY